MATKTGTGTAGAGCGGQIGREWAGAKRQVGKAISTTLEEVKSEGLAFTDWVKTGKGSSAVRAAGRSILSSYRKHRAATTGAAPQK